MKWTYDHITVFLTNGTTLRFYKVTNYDMTGGWIACFDYESASDGKRNSATLYLDKVVMVAGANGVQA
jgi:hypothetical protein